MAYQKPKRIFHNFWQMIFVFNKKVHKHVKYFLKIKPKGYVFFKKIIDVYLCDFPAPFNRELAPRGQWEPFITPLEYGFNWIVAPFWQMPFWKLLAAWPFNNLICVLSEVPFVRAWPFVVGPKPFFTWFWLDFFRSGAFLISKSSLKIRRLLVFLAMNVS